MLDFAVRVEGSQVQSLLGLTCISKVDKNIHIVQKEDDWNG